MMRAIPILSLFPSLILSLPLVAGEARQSAQSEDRFGYTALDSADPLCSAAPIDLGDAEALALTAASDAAPADDDGGAAVALALPFAFYRQMHETLVVSSNGYLAFSETGLAGEDGGHWRGDCPLPAIPDNRRASFARIYALGGDLERGPGGALRHAHFADCPRPPSFGSDACTVIEWSDWRRRGQSGALHAQVVLYHGRREIVIQYGALDAAAAAGLTVGIQDHGADSALLLGCGAGYAPEPMSALCLFAPLGIFRDGFEGADED
jgi:hypothetical protein